MDNTKRKNNWFLPIILLLCLCVICGRFWYYQLNRIDADIEKLKESIVLINSCNSYGVHKAIGSGVISYQNNEVITCYHVIDDDIPQFEVVLNNGTAVKVDSIVAYNEELDLAVLRLEKEVNAKPLKVTACNIKPGDKVFTISSPGGELNVISKGTYEGIIGTGTEEYISTTAKANPGSSGGALFDRNANLIGIICKVDPDNSYAVPAIKTDDVLQDNRVDYKMVEFYSARRLSEPIVISAAELLNNKEGYHNSDVIVYGFVQKIDEKTILITADSGETDDILTINIEHITAASDFALGKEVYVIGLFLNATERPILYARILEIKDELDDVQY